MPSRKLISSNKAFTEASRDLLLSENMFSRGDAFNIDF